MAYIYIYTAYKSGTSFDLSIPKKPWDLRKSIWTVKYVFGFSVTLFWTIFLSDNIMRFMFEILAESREGLHVRYLVFLPNFVLNWNISTESNKLPYLKEIPHTGTWVVTSK